MFHLAGIPSYLLVAELGINRVLRGDLPHPEYPQTLRKTAPAVWIERARMTVGYARNAYFDGGRLTELAGALAVSAAMAAHAVLAARGEWVTNEKRLLERAGLRDMDDLISGLQRGQADSDGLTDQAVQLFDDALATATA